MTSPKDPPGSTETRPWIAEQPLVAHIFTLVAEDYWLKLEIVTTMQTGTVGPARCTFGGTAELVRKAGRPM